MLSAEEEEEEGLGEPLILRIDQDDQGSVGSEDTSRFESDDDLPPAEAGEHFPVHLGLVLILPTLLTHTWHPRAAPPLLLHSRANVIALSQHASTE